MRYLNPVDHNSKRINKSDKDFSKKLDFKDIKFPVKIRVYTSNSSTGCVARITQ